MPAWDWVSIIGTGQSLAVGGHGDLPEEPFGGTRQRFANLKLSLAGARVPPFDAANPALSMVPLVEPLRAVASSYPSPYPANIYGQSFHTAMADQVTALARTALGRDYVTVHTAVGEAGQAVAAIAKGAADTGTTGRAYAASLFEVASIARLARAAGKRHGVGTVVITHGESDAESVQFESDLVALSADYNRDLCALTGQTTRIPLLVSQQHATPTPAGSRSRATLAQWAAGVHHPDDIVCTGPKYQYPYIGDALHLTNPGYDLLGEKVGQIYLERVVLGKRWQPLQPTRVARSGRTITVEFHVPVAPLTWASALPAPHRAGSGAWAQGRGFEVRSGDTAIAIGGVEIAGNAVAITCLADLPSSELMVGYAATADVAARSGGTLRWGQLRDSDPFVGSVSGATQPNYCVAFELNVPREGP